MLIERGANANLDVVITPKQVRGDLTRGGHRRKFSSNVCMYRARWTIDGYDLGKKSSSTALQSGALLRWIPSMIVNQLKLLLRHAAVDRTDSPSAPPALSSAARRPRDRGRASVHAVPIAPDLGTRGGSGATEARCRPPHPPDLRSPPRPLRRPSESRPLRPLHHQTGEKAAGSAPRVASDTRVLG